MKYLDKINKLADSFEYKLRKNAQGVMPATEQLGTSELFFDTEANQLAFNAAIQNPKGAAFKVLNDCYTKTQAACSFDLKATADPGKGASWQLTVVPDSIKGAITAALDGEYKKIMKVSMSDRQRAADSKAKQSQSGSGTLPIGALDLS